MKKHLFLTAIAMLGLFHLQGNNPGKKSPIEPLPKITLPYLGMSLPDIDTLENTLTVFSQLDKVEVKENKQERFYFPELEQNLAATSSSFSTLFLEEEDDMNDVINAGEKDADAAKKEKDYKKILDEGKLGGTYLDNWEDLATMVLPAYRIEPIGNLEALIVINSLTIEPDPTAEGGAGGKLGIYIGIKIPQKSYDKNLNKKNVTLIFGTESLGFSPENGISLGDIVLANDVAFEIGKKKESFVVIKKGTGSGTDNLKGTYLKFGCNGIEEMGLSGEVHFSRKMLVPLKPDGKVLPAGTPTKRVVAAIPQIRVQDWNDILVEGMGVNHPFALTKYPNLGFNLNNANLDMSDKRNPSSLVFPDGYDNGVEEDEDAPPINLWRGIFIKQIEVTLPNPFKKKCDGVGDTHFRFPDEPADLMENDELLAEHIPIETIQSTYTWDADMPRNNHGPAPPDIEIVPADIEPTNFLEDPETEVCKISFGAKNLLIDKTGVSGSFYVGGAAPLHSGPLISKKWSWSLDQISIRVLQSDIDGFTIDGGIVIPIAKKDRPFGFKGELVTQYQNTTPIGKKFTFTVKNEKKIEFPLWDAFDVEVHPNTQLLITKKEDGEDFEASVKLFGKMSVGKGISSDARIPHLKFENLYLSTKDSVSLTGGGIYLVGGGTKLTNFPIQISQIGLKSGGPNKWGINLVLSLNLMEQTDGGLSAAGQFTIWGKRQTNVLGAHEWVFDKVQLSAISVCIDLPAFKGSGQLNLFKDHEVYGKGFSASMQASILSSQANYNCGVPQPGALNLEMMGIFGNKNGLRYFLVDGFASSDEVSIPITPTPFSINGVGGGVFYHMKPSGYQDPEELDSDALEAAIGLSTSGIIYEPTPNTSFGIKFSTSLILTSSAANPNEPSPFNGKLTCIIRFGSGMSLQNITFWGTGEYLLESGGGFGGIDIGERIQTVALPEDEMHQHDEEDVQIVQENKIKGKMGLSLDFEKGVFHAYSNITMSLVDGAITGHGTMDLLIDPDNEKFHLYIGGYRDNSIVVPDFFDPENKVEILTPLNVLVDFEESLGLTAKAEVYFLLGNEIPGPPPVHPEAARYFEIEENANNLDRLTCGGNSPTLGTGIAFGASLFFTMKQKVKINLGIAKITILEAKVEGGVGFDVALLKYGGATTCNDGTSPHGVKGFRATGNIWAFVLASGKAFGMPIGSGIGAGVYLGADIPNPSYFKTVAILDIGKRFKFNLDLGSECGFPCSVNNE